MKYVQFFTMSTGYVAGSIPPRFDAANMRPIEACGSDGVHILDGRCGMPRCVAVARAECRRRKYVGFTIMTGESFTNSHALRGLEVIHA